MQEIRERNTRVEADKAWETSKTRRAILALSIYLIAVLLFTTINTPQPWLDALVPTLAFVLSTLSFPFFKEWWLKNIYQK